MFRIYRLAAIGGLYCDADSKPQAKAKTFIQNAGQSLWVSASTRSASGSLSNGFIAAPTKHPLIEGFLETILRNLQSSSFRNIYWLTGPGALTKYIYNSTGQLHVMPAGFMRSEVFKQFDAPYKYTEKNWRVYEHSRKLTNELGLKAFFTEAEN